MKTDLTTFGKIPPQARDLEEAVLGACLLEKDAVLTAISILRPDQFYVAVHQHIFSSVVRLFSKDEPVDLLTVKNDLQENGLLDDVGGPYFLSGLADKLASGANVEHHARIVKQKWIQRERIRIALGQIKDSYEDTSDALEGLGNSLNQYSDLLNKVSEGGSKIFSDVVKETFSEIVLAASKSEDQKYIIGHTTGNSELDKISLGYNDSNFVLIAGRNSDGKTSLVLTGLLENAKRKIPVGLFSLEMKQKEVIQKFVAMETGIEVERIRSGRLEKYEWQRMDQVKQMLLDLPVHICDKGAIELSELSAIAKGWKAKYGVKIFVIDYVQLMEFDNKKVTPEQKISGISRRLKALAKELESPVVAISSLSRKLEDRSGWDKRPRDSDLREGGSLEYDADLIVFVFRPENHSLDSFEDGRSTKGVVELIISKNRLGSRGIIKQNVDNGTGKLSRYEARTIIKQDYFQPADTSPF